MPFALLTSDTYTLRVFTPLENISIENVTFEGSNNASATRGVILQQTRNLTLNNVRFQNFVGAAGAYIDEGLGTQLSNLTAFNSGTGSEAAFNIRAQTDISALGIRDRLSTGFGQLWFMITYGNMAQLSSNRAGLGVASAGRGVKFDGCLYSTMDQIEGNDSGSTGVAITLGSNFNVFSNIVALRNRAGSPSNDIGLWFDGTSSDNLINGVIAKNNLTADLFIPTGSNRNVILNADVDTMSDGGTAQIGGIDNLVFGKKTLGLVLAGWVNVDFNSANTDFPITLVLPSKRFRFETIFVINTGTTASLTTARGGLFTAAAGGGTALVADQALAAITSNTVAVSANNLAVGSANTGWWDTTTPTVFWRTSTAQGAAATGRVFVYIRPMPG
jgi:hypothetical protein